MRIATFSIMSLLWVPFCDVGTARADISIELIEVTADSGTLESDYVADIPAGFTSWQLLITTDTKWIGSELDLVLEQGSIYYGPLGGNPGSPNAALFDSYPSSRFATHLSGTNFDPADGQRQSTSFAPDPVREGKNKKYTDQEMITTWYTSDPNRETVGTHVIGMITLSDDAVGTFRMNATDPDSATQIDPSTAKVLSNPNPFIVNSKILNGQFILSDVRGGFVGPAIVDSETDAPSDPDPEEVITPAVPFPVDVVITDPTWWVIFRDADVDLSDFNLVQPVLSAGEIIAPADAHAAEAPDVPEPSTALLAILGLMGLIVGAARHRR